MASVDRLRCRLRASWLFVRVLVLLVPLAISGNLLAGQLRLAWDPVVNATGYRMYYGTSSGNYASSIDAQNNTSVAVPGLTDGARYCFAVQAYNSMATSGFSNEVCGVVPASAAASNPFAVDVTPPARPQGLRVRM